MAVEELPMAAQMLAFLHHVLPADGLRIGCVMVGSVMRQQVFDTTEQLAQFLADADAKGLDAYHACAVYRERKGVYNDRKKKWEVRCQHNVLSVRCLWADIDTREGKPDAPCADQREALEAVAAFCSASGMPMPLFVSSGYGLHVYWPLSEPLPESAWRESAKRLAQLFATYGLKVDKSRTRDGASILRPPGTRNWKNGGCVPVECGDLVGPYLLEDLPLGSVVEAALIQNTRAHRITDDVTTGPDYPPAFAAEIVKHCAQLQYFIAHPDLPEPQWYASVGVAAFCQDGEAWVHEVSSGDPRHTHAQTQDKFDRCRDLTGATTCKRFHSLKPETCEACSHCGKIKSPIALGQRPPPNTSQNSDQLRSDTMGRESVTLGDFYAYLPQHEYIYVPTRALWPATSVNSKIPPIPAGNKPEPASVWLDRHQSVEQMTWAPGLPMLICDWLIAEGGWFSRRGARCFNLYRGPTLLHGDSSQAGPWIDHVKRIYGEDAEHIVLYLAHRVQRPHEKINHALVLGGYPGIGKDMLLVPVKHAIGPWNFAEASPQQVLGRFNSFLKSVILRISEARDLGR
jgi:hypothetical protein